MVEKLECQVDEFEVALGVATLAPYGVYREISEGLMKGETAEQIDKRLAKYSEAQ